MSKGKGKMEGEEWESLGKDSNTGTLRNGSRTRSVLRSRLWRCDCLSKGKSSAGEALPARQLPCPTCIQNREQSPAPPPPKCSSVGVMKRAKQEALRDTIRKHHEGTGKTVFVLYLTASDCPVRRNTVIAFPSSTLPLVVLLAVWWKIQQRC